MKFRNNIFSKLSLFLSGIFLLLLVSVHFQLGFIEVIFAAIFITILFSMFFSKKSLGILGLISIVGGILLTLSLY